MALLAAASGAVAAREWYNASRVNFVPFEEKGGKLVPVPTTDVQIWISAVQHTLAKSGCLNKYAALWTAASVFLAGLSGLLGALA
jgi:hypothetical protein